MSEYLVTYSDSDGTRWFEAFDISIVALTLKLLEPDPNYASIRAVSGYGEELLSADKLPDGRWSINLNNDFDEEEIQKFKIKYESLKLEYDKIDLLKEVLND